MKKIATAGLFLSMFAAGAFADTWSGIISDEHCGAKHVALSADDKACIDKCAKGGAAAVFVTGDKVYKVDNQDAVTKHLGHKVTINGTDRSNGYTITAVPQTVGKTGDRGFCSDQFGVIKYDPTGGTNCTQNLQ